MVKEIDNKYYTVDKDGNQGRELTPAEAFEQIIEDFVEIAENEKGKFVKPNSDIVTNMKLSKDIGFKLLRSKAVSYEGIERYSETLKKSLSICMGFHAHYIACLYFLIQLRRIWYHHDPDAMYDLFMWCKEDLFDLYLISIPTYMYIIDAFERTSELYIINYMKIDEESLKQDINNNIFKPHFYEDGRYHNYCFYKRWYLNESDKESSIFYYTLTAERYGYLKNTGHDSELAQNNYNKLTNKTYFIDPGDYDPYVAKEYDNNDICVDHLYILRFLVKTARFCLDENTFGTAIYTVVDRLCFNILNGNYEDYYFSTYDEKESYKPYYRFKPKSDNPFSLAEYCLYSNNPEDQVALKTRPQTFFPDGFENDRALTYKGKPTAVCDALAYFIYEGNNSKNDSDEMLLFLKMRKNILKKRGFKDKLRPTTREAYMLAKIRSNNKKTVIVTIIVSVILLIILGIRLYLQKNPGVVSFLLFMAPLVLAFGFGDTYYGRLSNIDNSLKEINKKLGK